MVHMINGAPARLLSKAEQDELDRLTDARRAALGRVLAAFVVQQADPSASHAHALHAAEQTYMDAALRTRALLST